MVLRRGNERMLTEVVFAIWPSLDGKPFRQRADKYSAAGFCSIQSQRGSSARSAVLEEKFQEQAVKRSSAKHVDRTRERYRANLRGSELSGICFGPL